MTRPAVPGTHGQEGRDRRDAAEAMRHRIVAAIEAYQPDRDEYAGGYLAGINLGLAIAADLARETK